MISESLVEIIIVFFPNIRESHYDEAESAGNKTQT
jgi:hypothetical protein